MKSRTRTTSPGTEGHSSVRSITKAIALSSLASAALLAGCSSQTGGTGGPTGQSDPTSSASNNQDLHGAPKVQNPLDTSKFQAAPCSVLTAAQLRTLGITQPGRATNAGGPTCDWQDTTSSKQLGVTVTAQTGNKGGLALLYQRHSKGELGVFEPISEINGYPAVIFSNGSKKSSTNCEIAVGVTDQLEYTIGAGVVDDSDPCAQDRQVAQIVVGNLKGGS